MNMLKASTAQKPYRGGVEVPSVFAEEYAVPEP